MSRAREETNEHFADAGKSSPEYYVAREGITFVCKKRPPLPQRVSVFSFLVFFLHLHFNLIYICKAKAKQKKANESKAKAKERKIKQCFYLLCFGLRSLYSLKLLRFRRFA